MAQKLTVKQPTTTRVVTEESEGGLAWTLFILMASLVLILTVIVVVMCCYIKSQKRQRMNAREVQDRSGGRGFAAESQSEFEDPYITPQEPA